MRHLFHNGKWDFIIEVLKWILLIVGAATIITVITLVIFALFIWP